MYLNYNSVHVALLALAADRSDATDDSADRADDVNGHDCTPLEQTLVVPLNFSTSNQNIHVLHRAETAFVTESENVGGNKKANESNPLKRTK